MKQQDINFVTQMIAMLDDEASLLTALNRTGKHNQRLQEIKVLKQDYINYLRFRAEAMKNISKQEQILEQ